MNNEQDLLKVGDIKGFLADIYSGRNIEFFVEDEKGTRLSCNARIGVTNEGEVQVILTHPVLRDINKAREIPETA